MSKYRGRRGQQHSRDDRPRRAEPALGPDGEQAAGRDKERQNAQARQQQRTQIVGALIEHPVADPPHVGVVCPLGRGESSEIRPDRNRHAGQRRMLFFNRVGPLTNPFEPAQDVHRLVVSLGENRRGQHDAHHADGDKAEKPPSPRTNQSRPLLVLTLIHTALSRVVAIRLAS